MKKLIRSLSLAALALTAFALPAFAQTTPATPAATPAAPAAAANPCEEAARGEMYTKYYELKGKKDTKGQPDPAAQKEAYGIGKDYLAKYASCNDTYSKAVQKFVTQYGDAVRKVGIEADFSDALYKTKDYAKAFDLGKQMLATDPENLDLLIQLGYAGYTAQSATPSITTFNPTSLGYAKKAVELLDAGKTPANWTFFKTKDEALGYLNFALGEYMRKDNPAGALPYYLKAATIAPTKDIALTYSRIAESYERGQYEQMKKDFAAKFEGKPETEESKYALNNLNEVIDRVMDAYARAISLAGSDPKFQQLKNEAMPILTGYYKFRKNTTDGLPEFIAGATSKPLPAPFTPQPFVPSATPAPSTGGTASDSGSGNGNGAMTTTGTPASTTAAPATTQPAATTQNTTATKPKPATKKP